MNKTLLAITLACSVAFMNCDYKITKKTPEKPPKFNSFKSDTPADWKFLTYNVDDIPFYLDVNHVKQRGDTSWFYMKSDYKSYVQPGYYYGYTVPAYHSVIFNKIICSERLIQNLGGAEFYTKTQKNKALVKPRSAEAILPTTVQESFLDTLCN